MLAVVQRARAQADVVVIDAEQIWAQGKDGLKGLLARFGGEGEPAHDEGLGMARHRKIGPHDRSSGTIDLRTE